MRNVYAACAGVDVRSWTRSLLRAVGGSAVPASPARMGIHDQTFRAFAMVRGVLDALLRERLDRSLVRQFAGTAELLSERFVDQHLKGTIADLVVRIPLRGGRHAYVYCLIEHKRTQERMLAIQLLRYQTSLYTWLARQRRGREPMPVIVALVIYNGTKPWRLGRRFSEMLRIAPSLRAQALDFKVHVLDLASAPASSLARHRTLRGGLLALKAATVKRRAQVPLMRNALHDLAGDHSTVATAVSYFQRIGRFRDVEAALEDEEEKAQMQTAAQYFKAKGRKEGIEKGLEKGLEKGIEKGLAEGRRRERQRQTRFLRSTIERVLAQRAEKLSEAQRRVLAKAELGTLESMLAALIDQRPLRTVFKS